MNTTINILFVLAFFVPFLLSILSFSISRRLASHEYKHLAEFWASLATMTVISYIFRSGNDNIVALSLLGWLWPLKTIMHVIKDMSGLEMLNRNKVIVVAVGFLTALILAYSNFPFSIYTFPFCLGFGIAGFMLLGEVYNKKKLKEIPSLANFSFMLFGLFFALRLIFPFWSVSDLYVYGLLAHVVVLIGLSATTVSYYMEVIKENHERVCKLALKERSDQFLGQSKYSELGMMSAGIAHEINNPLAIIQAKTTQLLRICHDPKRMLEVSSGLEQILQTSDRINRTIQGVRNFVHQDERVPNEEFSVKDLVDDVLAFCGQRMKNHGINLRLYGTDNYILKGHKIQLEQVLLNLLNNSFDAIEFLSDKWIEMSLNETEHCIEMFVKDSGTGIPPETARHMMDPFYTTKKVGKGTGLGLALAKGIVEKHGGSLEYVANAQHTTFKLELPKIKRYRPETHIQRDFNQGQGQSAVH
ncbi:MAG: GHKL domain-containing protein [Bdellovibrionales bacterium]|nr:GHKL domain-containing protein [Bdellovibrionales bacterium]